MLAGTIEIIKKDKIKLSGTVRVTPGERNAFVRLTISRTVPPGPVQARVVESSRDYAIIEVVCSCGCKTHIQCQYAAAKP